jgi:hypothetical protein
VPPKIDTPPSSTIMITWSPKPMPMSSPPEDSSNERIREEAAGSG